MKIFVFVGSHCPHCPVAVERTKKIIQTYPEHKIVFEKIRTKTSNGKELARQYGITAVPTVIILNDSGDEIKRIVGAPKESSLKNDIEEILGMKKSFLDRMFGR
jgi:thiol-disulfide isomerase/thioredoxin